MKRETYPKKKSKKKEPKKKNHDPQDSSIMELDEEGDLPNKQKKPKKNQKKKPQKRNHDLQDRSIMEQGDYPIDIKLNLKRKSDNKMKEPKPERMKAGYPPGMPIHTL
jgi:hypothetical protein